MWEIPGGSVDLSDPTILHGLAREVFEETGLKLTRFVRGVGNGIEFTTGRRKRWMKLSFDIEVEGKIDGMASHIASHAGGAEKASQTANCSTENTRITLDPAEHQAYKWATEEDIYGWGTDNIVTPEQREMMLLAFKQRHEAHQSHV